MTDTTLSPERWERVQEIFQAALDRQPETRSEFVANRAGNDEAVRLTVMSLLDVVSRGRGRKPGITTREEARRRLAAAISERYIIEEEVGVGGMATVYRAQDCKHNRKVAIKVLRPELAATLGEERFLREIEIIAGMQHPHILPLFDSGAVEDVLYYVMPFVEGDTLADRIGNQRALTVGETVQIASDILSALDYAHKRGIVHRDIKPSNVLISSSGGHAVVADFGIAHAVSAAEEDALTLPGVLIGTPGYMPPEQLAGGQVSPASDIYSVGVLVYESITGRSWFADGQTADWTGVPPSLVAILRRALAGPPGERWEDAATFRQALLAARSGSSPRMRIVVGLTAVLVAVAIGFSGWLLRDRVSTSDEPTVGNRVAVLPFTVRGSEDYAYLGDGMVDLLSTKLDGAGEWRSVDPRAVFSVLGREPGARHVDLALGQRIADQLEADQFVLGTLVEVGGQLRLDASLYTRGASSDRAVHASVEGEAPDVLRLLDEIAAQLLAAQPEARNARLTQLALVTTSSLPALKSYLRGVSDLRTARYATAVQAFQEAVAYDSTFALAWYQLSVGADWLLRAELARDAADRAVRYSDRLSERDRRLLEALRTVRRGDAVQAERMYRSLLGTYPDDVEALSQLGEVLFHHAPRIGNPIAASRDIWTRLAFLEPDRATAFVHLARLEASARNVLAIDSLVDHVLELAPDGDRIPELLMLRAYLRDDADAQQEAINRARVLNDDLLTEVVWSSGAFLHDPRKTMPLVAVMTEGSRSLESRTLGYGLRAFLQAARGRYTDAKAELDRMESIDPSAGLEYRALLDVLRAALVDTTDLSGVRSRLVALDAASVEPSVSPGVWFSAHDGLHGALRAYLLGLIDAFSVDRNGVAAAVRELGALTPPVGSGTLVSDMVHTINATMAWQSGRTDDALRALDQLELQIWHQLAVASPFYSQIVSRYLRGIVLETAGRLEEATVWYGSFDDTSVLDLVYLAPARYRLGKIYEQLDQPQVARAHFERFVALWSDADVQFQSMVDDARAALARVDSGR